MQATHKGKLNRYVSLVVKKKNLPSAASITLLSDVEILRVSGIGRVALQALREAYPIDSQALHEAHLNEQNDRKQARQERMANGTEFLRLGARFRVGVFHNVCAVKIRENGVLIQCQDAGYLMEIMPVFDRDIAEFNSINVNGEFGQIPKTRSQEKLPGICIRDVVGIEIIPDSTDLDDDFHTRLMRLKTSLGVTLEWELYCEGKFLEMDAQTA